MSMIERYLPDIKDCLHVYEQLYTMQKSDKFSVYNYIGEFYAKAATEQGRKQIIENAECYSRIMTNIHLFRWLEIERYQGQYDTDTIQIMLKNGLWQASSKELATKALDILSNLGIQPKQNGYQLDSELLLGYIQMKDIQTQTTGNIQAPEAQGYDQYTYDDGKVQADFDEVDEQDLGFGDFEDEDDDTDELDMEIAAELAQYEGEPEDYSDEDITIDEDDGEETLEDFDDEDDTELGLSDLGLGQYETAEPDEQASQASQASQAGAPYASEQPSQSGISEEELERRSKEAEEIRERNEAESNRVEIPIDTRTNKNIEIQFSKIIDQSYVQALMPTFKELYSNCYQGITSPDGILTPRGVLKYEQLSGDTRKQWHFNHSADGICGDTQVYKHYMNTVLYAIGVLSGAQQCQAAYNDAEQLNLKKKAIEAGKRILGDAMGFQKDAGENSRFPKIQHLSKGDNVYYPYMHYAFMTGYYALCSGLKAEQKEKGYHANTVKVTQYDDLSKWIKSQMKTCLLKAITDYGLGENAETYEVDAVCKKMINAIKNIVIIQDKQKAYLTIKVCQNVLKYSAKDLENTMNEYLTQTSGTSVGVKAIVKQLSSDVATIDIVLDDNKYNQNDLMAGNVIDSVIEQGQIPSWDNAILGRDDGGIVNYDFTKQNRCAVSIYGASGSGKGLITQAIIQNALIDNCNVFYFDGKPDNGASLAKIAWDREKEAAVFNGLTGGQNTYPASLESYQHGIRTDNLLYGAESVIPDFEVSPTAPLKVNWPFSQQTSSGQNLRKQLIDVSRTLMAFQFVSDMVEIRANSRDRDGNIKQAEDFCVFIIDEIQNAQAAEKNVRQQMYDYMQSVEGTEVTKRVKKETRNGVQYEEKRDGKIKDAKNWNKDPGYIFCKKWINWANGLAKVQWNELVTKQLRNSRCTIITIFQTNEWFTMDDKGIGRYGSPTCSRIGYMMKELQPKVTKFVGKNGLKATGQNSWGDLPIDKFSWKDEVQSGKWVLAKDEGGLTNDAMILRPFKIFTTDLGNGARVELDDKYSGGDKCRTSKDDIYDENGQEKKDPIGLDSYTHYMFNNLKNEILQKRTIGLTPEEVLFKGYTYFDDCMRQFRGAEQLQDYFYNLPQMVDALDLEDDTVMDSDEGPLADEDDEFSLDGHVESETAFDLQSPEQEDDFLAGLNSQIDDGEILDLDGDGTGEETGESGETLDFDDIGEDWNAGANQPSPGVVNFSGDSDDQLDSILNSPYQEQQPARPQPRTQTRPQPAAQQRLNTPDYSGRGQRVVRDTDGFETILDDYEDFTSPQDDNRSQAQYGQQGSISEMQAILTNPRLQADEKLAEMQKVVQKYNIKVSQADCLPLEGQMVPDYNTVNRQGFVQFSDRNRNKPHPIGQSTIVANQSDIQGIGGIDRETDRQLAVRYETVLNVICNNINKNTVVSMMITETTVQVNGRNLFLGRLLSNELTMADIVNVEKTFRRFGNLREFIIDLPVLSEAANEYGTDNPINQMFIRCPQLQRIVLLGNNGKMATINRNEKDQLSPEVLSMINDRATMDKIDAMSAQLLSDQRYKIKAVHVRKRIQKVATRMGNSQFGTNNSEFKNGTIQRRGREAIQRDRADDVGVQARKTFSNVGQIFKGFKGRKK